DMACQGVLDDAEIYSALRESKRALFQPRSGSGSWRKPLDFLESEGPALAWLNWSDEELRRHESHFSWAMQKLKYDIYRDVVLVQNSNLVKDPKTGKLREQFRPSELYRSARILQYLDPLKFPAGSSAQLKICTRLTNVWLNWQATTAHLASQAFFCGLIEELILGDEFSIQSGIRDRCGRTKVTGELSEHSGLSLKSRQVHQNFHLDVTALGKKISELKCIESKASPNS
ncbi:MAG: hypothetical protein WCH11_05875, partial [Bdellovibrio sp.]